MPPADKTSPRKAGRATPYGPGPEDTRDLRENFHEEIADLVDFYSVNKSPSEEELAKIAKTTRLLGFHISSSLTLADAEISPMKVGSVTKNKNNRISFNLRVEDSGDQRKNEEAILEAETLCKILAAAKGYGPVVVKLRTSTPEGMHSSTFLASKIDSLVLETSIERHGDPDIADVQMNDAAY